MNRFAMSTRGPMLKGFWLSVILTGGVNTAAPIIEKDMLRVRLISEFLIRWRGPLSVIFFHHLSMMVRHLHWRSERIREFPLGFKTFPFLNGFCCIHRFVVVNVHQYVCGYVHKAKSLCMGLCSVA